LTPTVVLRIERHKTVLVLVVISVLGYIVPYLNLLIVALACCTEAGFTITVTLKLYSRFLYYNAEAWNTCKPMLPVKADPVTPLHSAGTRMERQLQTSFVLFIWTNALQTANIEKTLVTKDEFSEDSH